jgi:hypothetical protein
MRKLISTTYKYQRGRRERGLSKGKERENNQRGRQEREREFSISTRVYNIYLYRNHPVRPSIYLVSPTPPKPLIGFL